MSGIRAMKVMNGRLARVRLCYGSRKSRMIPDKIEVGRKNGINKFNKEKNM